MDGSQFDALARSLAAGRSRRGLSRFFGGLALGGPLALQRLQAEARGKKGKKRKKKRKKKRGGQTALPGCTPNCFERTCGNDGCGGSCGPCAGNEVCQSGRCVCVPACGGKDCGDDGCGATCGTCAAPRTCQGGQCVCPGDCPPTWVRLPGTCDCCIDNEGFCSPTDDECCSDRCADSPGIGGLCHGLQRDDARTFDAQCASGDCRDAGIGVGTCA